jgi:putative thiamine transport system permease protein
MVEALRRAMTPPLFARQAIPVTLRLAPTAAIALLGGLVLAGLVGTALPAFGFLPALGRTGLSLEPWRAFLATPGLTRACLLSSGVGLAATALSLGIVTLFIAGWHGTRVFVLLVRLLSPLLSVPHAAAAFGLAFLIAPSGLVVRALARLTGGLAQPPDLLIVNDPHGLALIAGLIVKETPFLLLMALAALAQTDGERGMRTALSVGAGRVTAFLIAVFPRLYAQMRLPVAAVLAYSASTVDVALILGPTNPPTLAVELVRMANDPDLARRLAASAGALCQLLLVGMLLLVWRLAEVVVAALGREAAERGARGRFEPIWRSLGAGLAGLSSAIVLIGLGSLLLWSFASAWRYPDLLPKSLGLMTWDQVAPALAEASLRSLGLAACAAVLALVLALGALEGSERAAKASPRGLDLLLYVPLIVPQVAFLFGLQVLFAASGIGNGFVALLLVHLLFVLPYVLIALRDPWRALDPRYATVARALGASPARVLWRVRLPMLLRPILTAGAVGLAVSLGLYLPTLLIGAGRYATVTTEAVALAAGGDRRLVGAWAISQAALPAIGFAVAIAVPALVYRNRSGLRGP